MASFTLGDFRFDVFSYERVNVGGMVEERFVIDAFFQEKPLLWNGRSHREDWKFVGKLVQDVLNNRGEKVGTKRGADIRSSFFRSIYQRALAVQRGVRTGRISDAEVESATGALRDSLKSRTIDEAITELTRTAVASVRNR